MGMVALRALSRLLAIRTQSAKAVSAFACLFGGMVLLGGGGALWAQPNDPLHVPLSSSERAELGAISTETRNESLDAAQQALSGGVLVVNQQALFNQSLFGARSRNELERRSRELQSENRSIELELEQEEKALSLRRADLAAEEFRDLARAFDEKVQAIRIAQDAKGREIALQSELDEEKFASLALPILVDLLREKGAAVLLEQNAVILSFERIDITAEAIARINALAEASSVPSTSAEGDVSVDAADADAPEAAASE